MKHFPNRLTFSFSLAAALAMTACAGVKPPAVEARPPSGALHTMPTDLSLARSPDTVNPESAAELAEAALNLLNPLRTGGPDYAGAARMCLMAVDAAVSEVEADLRSSCHRVAARSALRSGDTALYLEAVDRWDTVATKVEHSAGEFLIHAAIRDRLREEGELPAVSDPLLRRVLGSDRPKTQGATR